MERFYYNRCSKFLPEVFWQECEGCCMEFLTFWMIPPCCLEADEVQQKFSWTQILVDVVDGEPIPDVVGGTT
ncbi:hypothetical protein TNCV_317081 [Trichonephila clavipes]|nr:hypothetical protein TNCV_317081 [Trichonephila clavipes]